jgi:hypothetical protein
MTRQCVGCSTVLPDPGRSPRCPRCRAEHDRARNKKKIRDYRQRTREYQPTLGGSEDPHLPTWPEIQWLNWLELDLADPVREVVGGIRLGTQPYHPEVVAHARIAVERYDGNREEFESRVLQQPGKADLWAQWRGFFEQLRGLLE